MRVFLEALKKLKHPDVEFMPFAVYSDDDEGKILKEYGIRSLKYPNEYIGEKKNAGLLELLKLDWDYMMELGSDDLVNPALIDLYLPLWERGVNCFGVNSCYFVDVKTRRVALWEHNYAIGAGRCIKRSVFDGFNQSWTVRYKSSAVVGDESYGKGKMMTYRRDIAEKLVDSGVCVLIEDKSEPMRLWTDTKNIALDADSEFRLGINGFSIRVIKAPPLVLDIKNGENIHAFDAFEDRVIDKDLGELERDFSWRLADLTDG